MIFVVGNINGSVKIYQNETNYLKPTCGTSSLRNGGGTGGGTGGGGIGFDDDDE